MHVNSGLSLKPEFLFSLFVLYEMQSRASFDVNRKEEINKCLLTLHVINNKSTSSFLFFSETIHVENTPT
jgi:hypothetical protein